MCQPTYAAHGWIVRRYWTRDERRAALERYAEELERELKGVKERIADLSSG